MSDADVRASWDQREPCRCCGDPWCTDCPPVCDECRRPLREGEIDVCRGCELSAPMDYGEVA